MTEFFTTQGKGKSVNGKGVDSPVGKGREDSATNTKCCCSNCPREYNVKPITGVTILSGGRVRVTCPGHGINAAFPRANYPSTQYINYVPCGTPFIFGCSLERLNTFPAAAAVEDADHFTCAPTIVPWPPLGPIAPPYGYLDRSVSGLVGWWPERSVRGHAWWMRLSFSGISVNPYHVVPINPDEPPYCWEELSVSGAAPTVTDMEVPWMTSYYYTWSGSGASGYEQYDEWYKVFTGPTCTRFGGYSSDQWIARLRIGVYDYDSSSAWHTRRFYKTATLTNYAIGTVCVADISHTYNLRPYPGDTLPTASDPEWGLNPDGTGPLYDTRTVNNLYTSGDSGDPCYPNSGFGGYGVWKPCKADFQTRSNEMGW